MAAQPATRQHPSAPAQVISEIRAPEFLEQVQLALPEGMAAHRFVRVAVTALLENPDLANADRQSLLRSIIRCAQDGLLPDGREATLVTYKGKVSYQPMVGGLRKLAREHGWTLRTGVVYANDEFDHTDEPPEIRHRPVRPGVERGALIAAWACATDRNGCREQLVMDATDIAKRRAKAQTQTIWNEWEPEMWSKTVAKALVKRLPLADSDRLLRVIQADDLDPGDAAAALYGSRARAALSPVVSEAPAGRQQAEPSQPVSPPEDEGSAPGETEPEPTREPEPQPEPEPGSKAAETSSAFVAPDPEAAATAEAARAAGATLIPDGVNEGAPINKAPLDWIRWALENPGEDSVKPIRSALELYARTYEADIWAQARGDGTAGEAA